MILQDISFNESDAVKNLYVVYRIRSENFIPDEVTTFLGIQPTRSFSQGDKYLGKIYDPDLKKTIEVWKERPFSLWDLDSEFLSPSKKVREHIEYLLNLLEPHSEQIVQNLLEIPKFRVSFYIRWEPQDGHGSYIIPNELLIRMGKLCNFVEFSFISSTDE